ncbi:hypothetical protein HK102_005789, partial [Quaeritorhiza haematococci]
MTATRNTTTYDIARRLLATGRWRCHLSSEEGEIFKAAASADLDTWNRFMDDPREFEYNRDMRRKLVVYDDGHLEGDTPSDPVPFTLVAAFNIRLMIYEQLLPTITDNQNPDYCSTVVDFERDPLYLLSSSTNASAAVNATATATAAGGATSMIFDGPNKKKKDDDDDDYDFDDPAAEEEQTPAPPAPIPLPPPQSQPPEPSAVDVPIPENLVSIDDMYYSLEYDVEALVRFDKIQEKYQQQQEEEQKKAQQQQQQQQNESQQEQQQHQHQQEQKLTKDDASEKS